MNDLASRANRVLAGLTLALAVAWWWSERVSDRREEADRRVRREVRFEPDDVTAAVVERPGFRVRLARDGLRWRLAEPLAAAADSVEVARLLHRLATDPVGPVIGPAEAAAALREYGLEPPWAQVALTRPGGILTFEIGDPLPGGRVYVRVLPFGALMLATTNLIAAMPDTIAALRDRTLFPGCADIGQIRIRRPDGFLHLARSDGGQWRLLQPVADRADRIAAGAIAELLLSTRIREFLRDDMVDGTAYGLDETAMEVTVDAGARGGGSVGLRIGGRAEAQPGHVYAAWPGQSSLFTIPAIVPAALATPVDDLRDRRLVPIPPEEIGMWTVERGERRLRVAKSEDTWQIIEPAAAEADGPRVSAFVQEWTSTRIEEFVLPSAKPPAPEGATSALVRVTFYRGEPSDRAAAPAVALLVADSPLDLTAVTVMDTDGTNSVRIRTKAPGFLTVEPVRYRSRVLLAVPPERVGGLLLSRGGAEQKVVRAATNGFVSAAGEPVPTALLAPKLQALSSLRAVNLLAEHPAEVVSFGLDPPAASLTVLSGEEGGGALTLLFGRPLAEGGVPALVRGRDVVGLLDAATAAALMSDLYPSGSGEAGQRAPAGPAP